MVPSDLRSAAILVVDDEQPNLDLLASCLADEGYDRVTCIGQSSEVMSVFETIRPDLILLDLHMPPPDGFETLRLLGDRIPREEYLPILVLTADVTEATKQRALSGGARDFLTKPLNLTEVALRIGNLLQTRLLHQHQRMARMEAEESSRRATVLADASQVLAGSFDYETTLSVLCRSIVPRLADYCVADVLRDDGTITRVGAAHLDPANESVLLESTAARLEILPRDHPVYLALTEGRPTLAPELSPASTDGLIAVGNDPAVVDRLRPESLISVPVVASGRIHGALVLAQSESGRRFEPADLELASELARRAALTIESALLYTQALQATKARDELLAVVAHDLRNPLSTVVMGAAMIRDQTTSPADRKHAELVSRAAERMNRLIEDLLDASRIERGSLRIDPRPQHPSSVVKEAVAMLEPLATGRQLQLTTRLGNTLPLVMMDAARILQVLSNLVGNAVKFTPPGGRIEIACEEREGEVLFAVADTGAGIPRDQIPHVFGRFWQASDRDTRGIGLGLSIVRGIVEAHAGRTWVESETGMGATFFFTLRNAPVEPPEGALHPGAATPSPAA